MKKSITKVKNIRVLIVAATLLIAYNAYAQPLNFRAHLSGDNQVPDPVATQAQGQAIFQLNADGTAIQYKLIAANIDNVFMAHIHMGFSDENGPVLVWLYPSPAATTGELIPGRFSGVLAEGTIFDEDVRPLNGQDIGLEGLLFRIAIGRTYVNVHTTQNPAGEIRGQIEGNFR